MRKQILVALFIFCMSLVLNAQQTGTPKHSNSSYGLYGHINYNMHNADFQKLPGVPNCCPRFESGTGLGFSLGALFEYKLSAPLLLGIRAGYSSFGALLSKTEPVTIIKDMQPQAGEFEHTLDATLNDVGIEPLLGWRPIKNLILYGGLHLGYMITKQYSQVETITKPADGATFIDSLGNDSHSRTRNESSGEIPNASSINFAVLGGIAYELPLNQNRTLILAPELFFQYGLTEIVENLSWNASSLRAGISIKYNPEIKIYKKEIFRKEYKTDTVRVESDIVAEDTFVKGVNNIQSVTDENDTEIITREIVSRTDTMFIKKAYRLNGSIAIAGVDDKGNEIPNPVFKVEEFISNRLDPLLNYVFFDENSSVIPSRYKTLNRRTITDFEVDSLYRESTLDIYYNILNIIAKRMTEDKNGSITLTGCNANIKDEKGNLELSQKRAEAVKKYLVDVWDINPNRINIEKRNLPANASTPIDENDKVQENRRVEITATNSEYLKPVFIKQVFRTANPPIARFKIKPEVEAGLKSWTFTAYQQSAKDFQFGKSGTSEIPDIIDWKLEQYQKLTPKSPESIIASLYLTDNKDNNKLIEAKSLPVEITTIKRKRIEKIEDYEIEKYSLILFKFDKWTIEGNNKEIIKFIKNRIKPESIIEITGHTDRTGDTAYNKKLSEKRANSAKNALKRKDASAIGIGKTDLLYDNDTPEGRFYCRTVVITVKTPVK